VAAVITDDHGRALLIQHADHHHWEPPGGVLELNESIEDGLRCEAREEPVSTSTRPAHRHLQDMTRGIIALVFRRKITGGNLAPNDETAAFRWASEHDIRELATEAYAIRVLDALSPRTSPVIRHHDGVHLL